MSNPTSSPSRPWLQRLGKPTFLYPLQGIWYFARHRFLWPLLKARIASCIILSLVVYTTLFFWTYLPQVALLAPFHGRLAWTAAAILVLDEGALIVPLLFEAFFVDEATVDIFDAVLLARGHEALVARGRILLPEAADNPVKQLGKPIGPAVYAPFSLRQIIEFVVLLPINLVPGIGVPIFLVLTGYRGGPLHHWRYFQLLGYDRRQRNEVIHQRRVRYMWFGTMAFVLQLVPGLQMAFLLTTAVGSALWAADLEDRRTRSVREEVRAEEQPAAPPEYTDNPV